jgi:hypothetical protein
MYGAEVDIHLATGMVLELSGCDWVEPHITKISLEMSIAILTVEDR